MGRSLREFDLQTRIFKYPLSYLIYSEAIDALPNAVKNVLYRRIRQILAGATQVEIFTSLEEDDRSAIAAILQDTKPEIFQE